MYLIHSRSKYIWAGKLVAEFKPLLLHPGKAGYVSSSHQSWLLDIVETPLPMLFPFPGGVSQPSTSNPKLQHACSLARPGRVDRPFQAFIKKPKFAQNAHSPNARVLLRPDVRSSKRGYIVESDEIPNALVLQAPFSKYSDRFFDAVSPSPKWHHPME
jgi:hypothetical protein